MDEREFMASYDAYSDALFRHCYFRLYDREEAKETVQETFLRAWKYAGKNDVKNMRALLYRIARNIIVDKFRKNKNTVMRTMSLDELLESGIEPKDDSHSRMQHSAEAKNFLKMLESLEDKEREVIIMRHLDGMGPEEIAEVLSEREGKDGAVSPNVISVRLNRAMAKIQGLVKINKY